MEILKFRDWLKARKGKRIFTINAKDVPLDIDLQEYMTQAVERIMRKPQINSKTGEINMKYNPNNIPEDYYIVQRG